MITLITLNNGKKQICLEFKLLCLRISTPAGSCGSLNISSELHLRRGSKATPELLLENYDPKKD